MLMITSLEDGTRLCICHAQHMMLGYQDKYVSTIVLPSAAGSSTLNRVHMDLPASYLLKPCHIW